MHFLLKHSVLYFNLMHRTESWVVSIDEKMMETYLRWFGLVRRQPVDAPIKKGGFIGV